MFAALKKTPVGEFTGPVAGTLYYAYVPTTNTYWAMAHFEITPDASFQTKVNMQDGGDIGIFTRQPGHPWQAKLGEIPFPCPDEIPQPVLSVWGLAYSPTCTLASAESPARNGSPMSTQPMDIPLGTYFGTLLYFDLDLDGSGTILFDPETWNGPEPPANLRAGWFAITIGPSTTTGYWVGTDRANSHEVTGHFDLSFAQVVTSAMTPFITQPYSGYVITVNQPPGCEGSCRHAGSIVQINSVAPPPAAPKFTEPQP